MSTEERFRRNAPTRWSPRRGAERRALKAVLAELDREADERASGWARVGSTWAMSNPEPEPVDPEPVEPEPVDPNVHVEVDVEEHEAELERERRRRQ